MPPKSAQKPKAVEPEPELKPKAKLATPTKPTPKKKKDPPTYTSLEREPGVTIPIEIAFEGCSGQATLQKDGVYGHTLKLEASNAFALGKTIMLTEGDYEGYQAVLLRPAKAFPFLKLPNVVRARIYNIYFAPKGVLNAEIVLEGRRAAPGKDVYAKLYAEGSKNRVALLAVNREIAEEATPVFYKHTIKIESTATFIDFKSVLPNSMHHRITKININAWVKTQSRNAMHGLASFESLTHLHINSGVFPEGDPVKAAKYFYGESYKFLEAVGARKGNKQAGMDIISFGKQAFTYKDDKKNVRQWPEEMVKDFRKNVKARLK